MQDDYDDYPTPHTRPPPNIDDYSQPLELGSPGGAENRSASGPVDVGSVQINSPIVPAGTVTGTSLTLVVTIMCFLSCLTAGAVYIVRNPLDVAISLAHHISGTIDDAIHMMETRGLETAISDKNVHEIYGSWSQHVESWTHKPHRTIYVMRYEDMIANPFRAFGGLARHLLLRPTAEQLGKAIERASFKNLQEQEKKGGFREKPEKAEKFFREGKTGEWREKLNRRQVRRIVQAHHVQMRRFGYITDEVAHLVP